MPAIILPRRWQAQPQYPVELLPRYQSGWGGTLYLGRHVSLTPQSRGLVPSDPNISYPATPQGVVVAKVTDGVGHWGADNNYPSNYFDVLPTSPHTLIVQYRNVSTSANKHHFVVARALASAWGLAFGKGATYKRYLIAGTTTDAVYDSDLVLDTSAVHTTVTCTNGLTDTAPTMWNNGLRAGLTVTPGVGTPESSLDTLAIGNSIVGAATIDCAFYLLLPFRASESEAAEISRDPYGALFKPRRQVLYFSAGGATSATASSAGAATVTGAGQATFAGVASSTGAATVTGAGQATFAGVASSTGAATVTGAGQATFAGVASSAGAATVTGAGQATFAGVASSAGAATVTGTGQATFAGVASSAGAATVTGAGENAAGGTTNAVASSAGAATVTADGQAIFAGVGSSAGAATATGVGADGSIVVIEATAEAIGGSTTQAVAYSVAQTVAQASGLATVQATAVVLIPSVASSSGISDVLGIAPVIMAGVGTSTGGCVVLGVATEQQAEAERAAFIVLSTLEMHVVSPNRTTFITAPTGRGIHL